MKKTHTVTRRTDERRKGLTDWSRVGRLSDRQIDAAMANDPDWADTGETDWSKAELVVPVKKKAISIRVDEDVLAFFKSSGEGYQGRMNAVLRSFMQQKAKSKARA